MAHVMSTIEIMFPKVVLAVKFTNELRASEGAVNLGGPSHEFRCLTIEKVYFSNGFSGPLTSKVVVRSQEGKFCLTNFFFYQKWVLLIDG